MADQIDMIPPPYGRLTDYHKPWHTNRKTTTSDHAEVLRKIKIRYDLRESVKRLRGKN